MLVWLCDTNERVDNPIYRKKIKKKKPCPTRGEVHYHHYRPVVRMSGVTIYSSVSWEMLSTYFAPWNDVLLCSPPTTAAATSPLGR